MKATSSNEGENTCISEIEIQTEVMRLKGELSVANLEIDRLRSVFSDESNGS